MVFLHLDRSSIADIAPGQSHDCRWSGISGTGAARMALDPARGRTPEVGDSTIRQGFSGDARSGPARPCAGVSPEVRKKAERLPLPQNSLGAEDLVDLPEPTAAYGNGIPAFPVEEQLPVIAGPLQRFDLAGVDNKTAVHTEKSVPRKSLFQI